MLLKPGDSGATVRELNAILGLIYFIDPKEGMINLLYPPFSDSSTFGSGTADAVIMFKRLVTWGRFPLKGSYTLDINSPLVDDQTWNALQETMMLFSLEEVPVTAPRIKPSRWFLYGLLVVAALGMFTEGR